MKHSLIIIVCAFLFMACATSRKTERDSVVSIETAVDSVADSVHVTDIAIDTAWWNNSTWTHTRITFEPDTLATQANADSVPNVVPSITIDGVTIPAGYVRVKTIEMTKATNEQGKQGVTERHDSVAVQSSMTATGNIQEQEHEKTTPVRVVSTWKIYAIALAIVAVLFMVVLKRQTIASYAKRVWSFIRMFI